MREVSDTNKNADNFAVEHTVILFYKYIRIDNPKEEVVRQRKLCEGLSLLGRMIIAEEGINATLEGTKENIEKYITEMKSDARFADVHWKKSVGTGSAFPKLKIKVRPEIVSLHLENDLNPNQVTGKRLSPEQLKQWYEEGRKFKIVDMRNDYEFKVGRFKDSVLPSLKNFRDLSKNLDAITDFKEETVLTVCTGGVRCEKASGLLVREGFKDVYQLDGGIVSYMEKFPAQEFEGTLYTFDNRIVMDFDPKDKHVVVGECDFCDDKTEDFYNCRNPQCNLKVLSCRHCFEEMGGQVFCSDECRDTIVSSKDVVVQSE
jgi:UPF0176 protein